MNREHFTLLADGLDALPEDYVHFDMDVFASGSGGYANDRPSTLIGCDTAACAVGHAPYI